MTPWHMLVGYKMEGTRGICVQCGCHLKNCFRFGPKCGIKLIVHKEVNGLGGGGGNSQVRCINVSNVPQTRLLPSKAIATPVPSSSSFIKRKRKKGI